MEQNPLSRLGELGQNVWLDFISRPLIYSGELYRLIKEEGISGVTSNPAIFQKAITAGEMYDQQIQILAEEGCTTDEIYDAIIEEDIQHAADLLRPVFEQTGGQDGFVSLEVSPYLAYDAEGAIVEARRLWSLVERPNLLIKIPATEEGMTAIRQCIAEGINVNATLLFGLYQYREVIEAYLKGLEERLKHGKPVHQVTSVASFFISRIDVIADRMLDNIIDQPTDETANNELAEGLRGEVAIACAKLAYQIYKQAFMSGRFMRLADHGAHVQRLVWASTAQKTPNTAISSISNHSLAPTPSPQCPWKRYKHTATTAIRQSVLKMVWKKPNGYSTAFQTLTSTWIPSYNS